VKSRNRLHEASSAEIARVRTVLVNSGVFADDVEVETVHAQAPWRIQLTDRGDVAVLGRWRDHLDILAIEVLWCREARITDAVTQLAELAAERGFDDLLAPPTPVEHVRPYEAAGMRVFETATTFVRTRLGDRPPDMCRVEGVTLVPATADDIRDVLECDYRCFDEFWRYDARHIERFLRRQRIVVARSAGEAIGYTLSTAERGDGMLGRIAVVPEWRGRGVGTMLVADVLEHMRGQGVDRVSLCTQTGNVAARALYERCGFVDTGRHFAFLRFGR
jgi:ribosomal protein S18 acetylase RimI-like enzyme